MSLPYYRRRYTRKRGTIKKTGGTINKTGGIIKKTGGIIKKTVGTIIICTPFYDIIQCIPNNKLSDYLIKRPIDVSLLEKQYSGMKSKLMESGCRVIDLHDHISASIRNNPEYVNFIFTQDHFIQTKRGIIMGRMKEPIRRGEPRIAKKILKENGIGPLYTVNSGFLEGGDYILHDNVSYIMDGPRTNNQAINELFHKDLFGTPTVVVLYGKMPDTDMHRIHLDIIVNFLDKNTVVVWKGALEGKHKKYVKVLDMRGNILEEDTSLRDYLIKHSFTIVEVSTKEQMEYKCNFVNVPNLGVLSQAPLEGTPTTVLDFSEVNNLYGGLRCSIKVI